jgi:hypothetical protein
MSCPLSSFRKTARIFVVSLIPALLVGGAPRTCDPSASAQGIYRKAGLVNRLYGVGQAGPYLGERRGNGTG